MREDVSFDSELFVDTLFSANRKISLGVFYRPPKSSINWLLDLQVALDIVLSSSPSSEGLNYIKDVSSPYLFLRQLEHHCFKKTSNRVLLIHCVNISAGSLGKKKVKVSGWSAGNLTLKAE